MKIIILLFVSIFIFSCKDPFKEKHSDTNKVSNGIGNICLPLEATYIKALGNDHHQVVFRGRTYMLCPQSYGCYSWVQIKE